MTIPAAERHTPVSFERATVVLDDYGGETSTWGTVATTTAKVLYGTGQERRQASQESATQAVTILCNWTPTLAGVGPTDRANFAGNVWDITGAVPIGLNDEIHIGALRQA